jgi:hypothetical protein
MVAGFARMVRSMDAEEARKGRERRGLMAVATTVRGGR